jgi:lipid II:glycine glycyltransferase (peptidoglycan interpeptide bridge formation enzyme)
MQSHAWGELKRRLGWTPRRYVIERDGAPVAVVSIQERALSARLPGPAGRLRYLYAPRGPVVLGEDDGKAAAGDAAAVLAGLRLIARARNAAVLTIDPAWEEAGPLAAALASAGFRPSPREVQVSRTAMVVPVEADEAAQHRLLGDSTARNINKARRAGVAADRVDLLDPGAAEPALAEFFAMYEATGRREGFLVRDRDYLLEGWRALGAAGNATLWFTAAGGRRRNGVILLHCGRRLVSHQAGSPDDADLRGTRANHLLQWEILRWAAAAGFREYDLGGVDTRDAPGLPQDRSHPLWNLYEFKQGFGAHGVVLVRAHDHAPRALLGAAWRLARRLR